MKDKIIEEAKKLGAMELINDILDYVIDVGWERMPEDFQTFLINKKNEIVSHPHG